MQLKFPRFLITLIFATVSAGMSFGQAAGPTGGGVQNGQAGANAGKSDKAKGQQNDMRLEQAIWTKLTPPLTPNQKAEVAKINADAKNAVKALRDKAKTDDRQTLRLETQKIMKNRRERLLQILTPEQKKSYGDLMLQLAKDRRKDGKGKAGLNGKRGL